MNKPTRDDFVKAARTYALAYGRHDDAPSYLPRTEEAAATFEPHAWVIGALTHAFLDGVAEGRGLERSDILGGRSWIPVGAQLPEKNTEVLVAFAGISIASTGQYTGSDHDKHGWCYPAENYGTCDDGSDPVVTHWMYLPDAPKL